MVWEREAAGHDAPARRLLRGLLPLTLVAVAAIAAASDWIADPDVPPAANLFRHYSRVPCVGEFLDVGGGGHRTWRATQVMHGPQTSEATAWVEPAEPPEHG